jgi:hypothetical protein
MTGTSSSRTAAPDSALSAPALVVTVSVTSPPALPGVTCAGAKVHLSGTGTAPQLNAIG